MHSSRAGWIAGLGIAGLTLAVYTQVLGFDFVRLDDPRYVTENPVVAEGLTRDGVVWAFTTFHKSNWHPLSWLSHMLDSELYGLEPAGHHAGNVLLHLANALLLLGLLCSLTGHLWASAWVAALFAVHPLHVESVAWVAERKDVLSTFFGFLALWAWVGFARGGGARYYVLTVLLFVASLASKPMLVTLPCLLLLLDYWPLERLRFDRTLAARIGEKLPLFALAAVSSVVTMTAQRRGGALGWLQHLDLAERATNAVMAYATYTAKAFWPTNLAVFYPHPYGPGGDPWSGAQVAAAALVLGAVTLAVLASRRRYAVVGWLWYVGTLVPVCGLVQAGSQGMADRYTYVPLVGLFLSVAFAGREWAERSGATATRVLAGCAGGVSILALAVVAWGQTGKWHDSRTLFEHSLAVAPNALLHNSLGSVHAREGRIEAAVHHFREAVRIDPDHLAAHRNLAYRLRELGRNEEAMRHWLRSSGIGTDTAEGQMALGIALRAAGELDAAVSHFRRALELDPDSDAARSGLAEAHATREARDRP